MLKSRLNIMLSVLRIHFHGSKKPFMNSIPKIVTDLKPEIYHAAINIIIINIFNDDELKLMQTQACYLEWWQTQRQTQKTNTKTNIKTSTDTNKKDKHKDKQKRQTQRTNRSISSLMKNSKQLRKTRGMLLRMKTHTMQMRMKARFTWIIWNIRSTNTIQKDR